MIEFITTYKQEILWLWAACAIHNVIGIFKWYRRGSWDGVIGANYPTMDVLGVVIVLAPIFTLADIFFTVRNYFKKKD